MKFKYFFIFLFIVSCTTTSTVNYKKPRYSAEGFAYIYSNDDIEKNIIKKKIDPNDLIVGHNDLRRGLLLKITNPINGKHITLKNSLKVVYPDFYKVLITNSVAEKIGINKNYPFIDVQVLKKNKSFVAKKAEIFDEEKQINASAPIEKVNISNLGKQKQKEILSNPKFIILLGNFYSFNSAEMLKNRIKAESKPLSKRKVSIIKKNKHNYEVFLGPYKSIKMIEKDYIELKLINFDEVDIKLYE